MNYLKVYCNLIRKAENRTPPEGYIEKHHTFPVSIFGKNKRIVVLTAKEHYIAHALLERIFIKRYGLDNWKTIKMMNAFWYMNNIKTDNNYYNSYLYENSKIRYSQIVRGKNHPAYGVKRTPETCEKLRKSKLGENNPQYGKSPSQETRNKMSDANSGEKCYWYGKSHTQSSKEKMREAKLGDKNVNCKVWKLTFDDGRKIIIRGLTVWAEQNGYRHSGIRLLYQGYRNRYKDIIKVEQIS
jgi:hypothetical protein